MATNLLSVTLVSAALLSGCGAYAGQSAASSGDAAQGATLDAASASRSAVGALAKDGRVYCTGTLIARREVVTAAHCVAGVDSARVTFLLGERDGSPAYVLHADVTLAHPGFKGKPPGDDIGIVKLSDEAPIEPMPVLAAMDESFVGQKLRFVSCGAAAGQASVAPCHEHSALIEMTDLESETFTFGASGRHACGDDGGTPALHRTTLGDYELAGVTSQGDITCAKYGVAMRLDAYYDFLVESGAGED
jgi:secreted trypsin-like serine protease